MADRTDTPGQLMVARVGDLLIGVPVAEIVRILPMLPLWRPPTLPRPLAGFVSTQGGVLPVLDLRALLGLEGKPTPSLYAHIIEVGSIGRRAGLLVDRAEGFATPSALGALGPEETLNGCAVALFQYEGVAIAHLIAPDRLLDRASQGALSALTAEAERRRAEWQAAA